MGIAFINIKSSMDMMLKKVYDADSAAHLMWDYDRKDGEVSQEEVKDNSSNKDEEIIS